jgi:hypothetical protein
MATDHTDGAPPSFGKTILVNIGWTANSNNAETNSVVANNIGAMRRANGNAYAVVCRATLSKEVMTLILGRSKT